ncbi:hypothetical protein F5Y14DRAFT_401095 [Nemania sp. NC0429]|nr:hypothetical protein F5Y14DRAFT_401095 [Nemania sp. NC0429]
MKSSTLATVFLLGAASALPGSIPPTITAAPELKDNSVEKSASHSSNACTSTDCWASYAECNGSLTFVYLCYTPPPCGTATSPEPYSCPSPATHTSHPAAHVTSSTPTVVTIFPTSKTSISSSSHTGAVTFSTSTTSSQC